MTQAYEGGHSHIAAPAPTAPRPTGMIPCPEMEPSPESNDPRFDLACGKAEGGIET